VFDSERLRAANVNPATGLATDFLNQFNEAILLLELLPVSATGLDDLRAWRQMNYREYLANARHGEVAASAFAAADERARQSLDALSDVMGVIIASTVDALETHAGSPTGRILADQALAALKPLVARCAAIINGTEPSLLGMSGAAAHQSCLDPVPVR
jgi:hypothetical protein